VVVRQAPAQDARQSRFIHDDHVIETLASDGADDPLRIPVLPRGARSGAEFLDAHTTRRGGERDKRVVAVVNEIARGRVLRKGLAELLRGPERGRMCGHREVDNATTLMGQDDQHEQQSIRDGGHDEEIGGYHLIHMIGEECPPGLGRRASAARHVSGHGRLTDVDAELQESPWILGAPQSELASAILRINKRTSDGMVGRPRRRRLFQVQKSRKPRRCHARTVSGLTMTTAARHSFQRFDSQTHNIRSACVSRSRRRDRFTT
jgi:hypothetical protein